MAMLAMLAMVMVVMAGMVLLVNGGARHDGSRGGDWRFSTC